MKMVIHQQKNIWNIKYAILNITLLSHPLRDHIFYAILQKDIRQKKKHVKNEY